MRHQHDAQRNERCAEGCVARQGSEVAAYGGFKALRQNGVDDVEGRRHEQRQDQQCLPLRGLGEGQERPAGDRGEHPEDRRQRAAQIVDHLPARQRRHARPRVEDEA
jgi:hypothetical protein